MADYREISQEYARQGINAALLINGGAAVALLSQAGDLVAAGLADDVACPMILWAAGTMLAAFTWVLAFLSTRYVDKSERELSSTHVDTFNTYMLAGMIAVVLSLVCFSCGSVVLALAFL